MKAFTKIFILLSIVAAVNIQSTSANSLSSSIANAVNSFNDYTSGKFDSISEFIKSSTSTFWNTISPQDIGNFNSADLKSLYLDGSGKIPERIKKEIKRLMINTNTTVNELRSELRKGDVTSSTILRIKEILPTPEQFTEENVKNFDDDCLKLGASFLLRITDKKALESLNQIVERKLRYASTEQKRELEPLKKYLFLKEYGDPRSWTDETLQKLDLTSLTPNIVAQIQADVLITKKNEIISAIAGSKDQNLRRTVLKKIFEAEKFYEEKEPRKALEMINQLMNLKKDVLPEDIRQEEVQENTEIKAIVDANAKASVKNGNATPKTFRAIAEVFEKEEDITEKLADTEGRENLAFVSPLTFKMAALNQVINADYVSQIVNNMKKYEPGMENKLDTCASMVADRLRGENNPQVQNYPPDVIKHLGTDILKKVSTSTAKVILEKEDSYKLGPTRMAILLLKVNDCDFNRLNEKAKAVISTNRLTKCNNDQLLQVSKDLPITTTAGKMVAEKYFKDIDVIDEGVIRRLEAAMPYIGVSEAMKFKEEDLLKTLPIMKEKNINPTLEACIVLKNKFLNYSINNFGATDEMSTMQRMLSSDIETMPVCVLAAFGSENLWHLGKQQKIVLMEELGKMEHNDFSTTISARMSIVGYGLKAMGGRSGLQPGDLQIIGMSILDIPEEEISSLSAEVIPEYIKNLNMMIKEKKMKPCFNPSQRTAIWEALIKFKGTPSQWDYVDDVSCLLIYLPKSEYLKIPNVAFSSAQCEYVTIPEIQEIVEALCKGVIGENDWEIIKAEEKEYEKAKIDAGLKAHVEMKSQISSTRTKREASTEDCSGLGFGGANTMTNSKLESFSSADVMVCLRDFGLQDMDEYKATILARKVREGVDNDMKDLNASVIADLGFILKGFTSSDLNNLPNLKYGEFDEVVTTMGSNNMFREDQRDVLANKVKLQWRSPSSQIGSDLNMVNYLICSFTLPDIDSINLDAFKTALPTMKNVLKECEMDPVIQSFAKLAKRAYGNPDTWSKSRVSELGVIIAGLMPQDINMIKASAFEGLTPEAMKQLTTDAIKTLEAEQLKYLSSATATSVSSSQCADLDTNMRLAVNSALGASVKYDGSKRNGAMSIMGSTNYYRLILLAIAVALQRM